MTGVTVTGARLLQRGVRCVLNNSCIVSQLQQHGLRLPHVSFAVRSLTTQDDKPSKQFDLDKKVVENLQNIREGKWGDVKDPEDLKHFRSKSQPEKVIREGDSNVPEDGTDQPPMGYVVLPHPIWSDEEIYGVQITHKEPERFVDKLAYSTVKTLRAVFDYFSGFNTKERDDKMWINRICFLETVAAVPGMVAAMVRHLHSLRRMRRDHGWIHTLLEEAENERMHLMTALSLKEPTWKFRAAVLLTQGFFVTYWGLAYLFSARYCHRFVGYLEEEAVITYTKCLGDIDGEGPMKKWKTLAAPPVAVRYWQLPEDATMRDVILAIRADEAHHRVVNHTLASMKTDDYNPYKKLGSH